MTLVDQPNNTSSFLFLCSTRTTPQYKIIIIIKKALNHQYQMLLLLLLLFAASLSTRDVYCQEQQQLMVGFYTDRCPDAESIVTSTVGEVASSAPNTPALLLRLHFHDCFVQGCDGSILIQNGNNAEKNAFGHQGVGGFDVIDKAKSKLEAVCPGVVSCSDIVALAARDAIALANGPAYQVQTGRRDGTVSDMSLAANMPDVQDSIEVIKSKFREKGLTDKDLVLLSAAHTIGTTACFFMTNRLYQFPSPGGSDPSINPNLLPELKQTCPKGGNNGVRLEIDRGSGNKFDDNILQNIRNGFAVLQSDARLYQDDATKAVVDSYFGLLTPIFGPSFEADFVEAIVKMGAIGVKTGSSGTIRKVCSAIN